MVLRMTSLWHTSGRTEYVDTPQGFTKMGLVLFYNAITQMGIKANLAATQVQGFQKALWDIAYEE